MFDILAYLVAGVLLLQAAWRLPSALRGEGRRRTLWGFFAAFACAWLLKTEYIDALVERSGINDLSSLLKHVIAIAGICSLLTYLTSVYGTEAAGDGEQPRHVRVTHGVAQVARRAALATVLLMTGLFFFAIDRSEPTEHFITGHAGDVGMAVYMSVLYLYMGAAATVAAYQWGGAARRATRRLLRTGLAMMSAAMVLAVLYAVLRTVYLGIVTVTPTTQEFDDLQETVTESLQLFLFPLLALGATAPASQAAVNRWRAYRALAALYPMWRDLALAVPDQILDRPRQLLPGRAWTAPINKALNLVARGAPPQVRLARCVTEIRDVIRDLRYYAPADLLTRTLADAGGDQVTAEAHWIKAALALKASGRPPLPSPVDFTSGAGDELADEVPWLIEVTSVYRATTAERVADLTGALTDAPTDTTPASA
ncbi:MAB_1171c family putative transporter [Streptomyces gobiensis]|uniref:MAB_1171c family putative transporter n=1 Tax=Streptomyces gobiensis TaxID=2875706 RepID=UPI001E4B21E0|nr:MAB_1171c family putative transporter [Streptomyces gobiensis]UGY91498.1 hypothetical protein test1122_07030 [Streptomyces gobiensis]